MQEAQQHVRRPLRVIREHNVTIPLERTVKSAQEDNRHLFVSVPMRIAHVASLIDQYMIENTAVAIGYLFQLVGEVRKVLHVITVHLRVIGDVLRLVAMVRRSMPSPGIPGLGEAAAGKIET